MTCSVVRAVKPVLPSANPRPHAVDDDEVREDREPMDDGYSLTFEPSGDIIALISRVIDAERQCCPWLPFTLTVAADAGPILLRLTGSAGAREFLAALFDA